MNFSTAISRLVNKLHFKTVKSCVVRLRTCSGPSPFLAPTQPLSWPLLMDPSCQDFSYGVLFVAKVWQLLFSPVASPTPDHADSFWLIASFSRSKFCLDSSSVILILASVLGEESSRLSVVEVDQWVFKFCVASSKGFMIYALKSFACTDFKLHFNL